MKIRIGKILWTECATFKVGDLVIHDRQPASVVSISAEAVPRGNVPIMHNNDFGCIIFVPADSLYHRSPGMLEKLRGGIVVCLSFLAGESW